MAHHAETPDPEMAERLAEAIKDEGEIAFAGGKINISLSVKRWRS